MTGSVKEAIEELKKGKLILVVDDEDRENDTKPSCSKRILHIVGRSAVVCAVISFLLVDLSQC